MITISKAIEIANTLSYDIVNINIGHGEYRIENIDINSSKQLKFFGEGDNTIIKGSKKLTNPIKVSEGIYKFAAPNNKRLYQIFVNGDSRLCASTKRENGGTDGLCIIPQDISYEDAGAFRLYTVSFSSNDISVLNNCKGNAFLTIFSKWRSCKSEIISVDTNSNTVKFYVPFINNANIEPGNLFVIENINGTLDINGSNECFTDGTYYHDISNGFIYYKLKPDETIDNITVEVPVCSRININCEATFSNIKFCQYNGNIINDINKKCCTDGQGGYKIDGTFRVKSKNVNFTRCSFYGFTNHCIRYYNGSCDSIVEKCHFLHCGCGSVYLGDVDKNATDVPNNIRVQNNVIQYMSDLLQQSCGIVSSLVYDCSISNNEVSYINYSGITGGLRWDDEKSAYANCSYNNNHIHHINYNKILYDMAGIYTVGRSDNTKIFGNKIHDIMAHNKCFGIYLDEGSSGVKVYKNIVYKTQGPCIFGHRSKNNDVYNNIFAFPLSTSISYQARSTDYCEDRCYNNIIYGDNKDSVFNVSCGNSNCEINSNLYYCTNGNDTVYVDKNAVYLDPKFKNPSEYDFTITDTSNVDNIDFDLFDDKSGVKGSIMKSLII